MSLLGGIKLPVLSSDPVDSPAIGKVFIYSVSGTIRYKNNSGQVFTLATGVSQEVAEDIVANLLTEGNGININYDDQNNQLIVSVNESQINHQLLSGAGTNTHTQIDSHISNNSNPHSVTKTQVGLGNVDNTSDSDKPISTATQNALDLKENTGVAASIVSSHESASNPHPQYETSPEAQAKVDAHANLTDNPHSVTKAQVGLGNVDNTSDANKPVSSATQTALDGKQTNPFGVCQIERTGTFYTTFASAIAAMQDYDTLIKLSGNHQAQAMDFTSSGLSNITIFARGSSGTANNIVGNVFLDSTCTNFEFHNIDIIAASSDSLVDTGSVGSSFNECRIDRNSGAVAVRISGASASGVRFSNCIINKDISLNGTNFSGFITVIQCTVDDIIGNNNQGAFIDYTLINSSLQVAAASYLEVRNTIVPYIKSTQTNMGFPTFVLSNVQVRDPAAAQSSQIIDKTGTAQYSFLDVKYKIVGSTTNGTNASNAFPVSYAYNLMGKTGTALSALTRVAGMLHHNQTSTRPNWDDGTTLNELAYTSDAITTHSGLTLDDGTNPHGTTKADVGLGNVDNTSDADKPVSTATQTALNLKYDASNPAGYETPAQLNARDTNNRNRANHTGTQLSSSISDFTNSVLATLLTGYSIGANLALLATDSVLVALGKLQAQINAIVGSLVRGDNFQYFEDLTPATTTSSTYSDAASFTTTTKQAGNYRIGCQIRFSAHSTNNDFLFRLLVDGVQVGAEIAEESKDNSSQGNVRHVWGYVDFPIEATHTIAVQFRQETPAGTLTCSEVYIEMWRR